MDHGERLTARRAFRKEGLLSIVVGVSGGIAAYKACAAVRLFKEAGHRVTVVATRAALDLVGAVTWEALSGRRVYTDVCEDAADVAHVRLAREADAIVVVPATANTLAKIRAGIADNMLTSVVLAATCPVFVAPAMHTEMWFNPATQENAAVLRERGVRFIGPASGRLTGADSGVGRLSEPGDVVAAVLSAMRESGGPRDLLGLTFAVSAGGTREPIDPVRYLGNRSTGRFGTAITRLAAERGAKAILVESNVASDVLREAGDAEIRHAPSALELRDAMQAASLEADVLVMAAAVADFRPAKASPTKQKKTGESFLPIELVENPDVLAGLAAARRPGQTIVGFAAETGDERCSVEDYGREKALRKGADLTVVNGVGEGIGFGDVDSRIVVLDSKGDVVARAEGSKEELARVIVDAVVRLRS